MTSAAETNISTGELEIRSLRARDLPAVLSIEQQSYPHPWSQAQFVQELDNPVASVDLAWSGQQLAGYLCSWWIAGELQILNIATAPQFRRQGVAGRLFAHLFARLRPQGLQRAFLEVRAGNRGAIALYRAQGFVADTVRSGYYRDGEDALIMVKEFSAESVAGEDRAQEVGG